MSRPDPDSRADSDGIAIDIRDVHAGFGSNKVLNGASLKIRRGETITIIGRSGVGKSVLLKHIIGLMKPQKGSILIDGEDISKYNREQMNRLRRRFGMLFQGAALFDSMTVYENVGLELRELTRLPETQIRQIVDEKLRMVGLNNIGHLKPAELSGGMKKRVGLARAIAMDPEFILYDEPTTGLDPIMADVINNLIIRLQRELSVTAIAVTHDMVSAYKISDRIAMIHDGKIIFVGTPEETRNSDNPIVRQFVRGSSEGPISSL